MNRFKFYLFAYWYDPRWEKFVGATVKIWDLAQNLSNLGHDVTLFLPRYNFNNRVSSINVVEIPFLNLPFLRSLSFKLFLAFYLLSFFINKRPDVVYTRRMGSILPGIYAKLVNAVFFYEINDDPYRRAYQEGSLIAFRIRKTISEWQDEINLYLCQRAFVITRKILEKIEKYNPGLQNHKLVEMPSGANSELFRPISQKECRAIINIDFEKKYIGFAGTLLKHQGINVLINAAPLILKKETSSAFIVIGEGPMKDIWINDVERHNLKEHFIFTGQIDYQDLPKWINAMDICVAPFLSNVGLSSPVKIFDYMSCGKPVVASDIEGTTDIFSASGAIKLIEPGSAEGLSNAIVDLLRHPSKSNKMGKNGRKFILETYDRKSIAKRIYEEAVSCKP
jgi:glycosyltransferase involved in cell wall biosynthesis